jgi:hypothetical protein
MNRFSVIGTIPAALLAFGIAGPWSGAAAQPKPPEDPIAGAWVYVAVDTVRPDGSRTPMYGPNPQGLVIFDGHGHYALVNARSDLPKVASNNRMQATPDEYKAIAQGSIAHFGKYAINEADKTITFEIQGSTFPNWDGAVQKRPFVLNGDELRWTTRAASGGGTGEVVLKRAK